MEQFAFAFAKERGCRVWLVLSKRTRMWFDEKGGPAFLRPKQCAARSAIGRAVLGVPALRVRNGEPPEGIGDLRFLVASRPNDEVPVIATQRTGQHAQRHPRASLGQHLLKRGEVGLFLEQPQPTVGSIEHMLRRAAHQRPGTSGQARIRFTSRCVVNGNDSHPLSVSSKDM
jgi:hypothetical protein